MSEASETSGYGAPYRHTMDYQRLVNCAYAVFLVSGIISALKPSPYDFLFCLVAPMWFVGGFKIHRFLFFILVLWIVFELAGFLALMPYWEEVDPRVYQFQSLYIFCTAIFFTIFLSERSIERAELSLKAYTFGAFFCALLGIASYFDIGGIGPLWSRDEGRAASTFDDPNLYGSYLTLSGVYILQNLLLGTTRRTLLSVGALVVFVVGVFVSYSRGSWGALIIASLMMAIAGFLTVRSRKTRKRIAMAGGVTVGLCVLVVVGLLAQPEMREMFTERATIAQSYDEGETGRFGNQARSIPMLIERPGGFGPLRFSTIFYLEPHNSYIGAFANDGWIGGFTWIVIVISTSIVGFRLMFVRSPYQRLSQVFWPTLFAWLLQGFQIDIDHWRQMFLCFGAVWGFEAARRRWLASQDKIAAEASTDGAPADEEEPWPAAPMH
jgi:O-Antigen ligase